MSRRRGDTTVLATLLFTDIVGSTEIAAELGDRRWRDLIERHHAIVRRELKRFRGRELDTAGDGFFARFDRPADAVRCACAASDAVRELGIEIRAGLHVGEVELVEGKVGGIGVNVAARVMGVGKAGEVLVSSTLRDAAAGSGFAFADHGVHRLKGIEGEWRLFEVTAADGVRRGLPLSDEEAHIRRSFVEPRAVRSWRDRAVAIGVGAVVVALVGAGMLTGAFGGDRPGPGPSVGPSAGERELLGLVPEALRASCTSAEVVPPEAVVAGDGVDGDDYAVTYASFPTVEVLRERFEAFAAGATGGGDDCATQPSAVGAYTLNGQERGGVACYLEDRRSGLSTASSVLVWTDEELLVLGRAVRGDAADLTLYEWWRTEAGPAIGGSVPPKDGAVDLLEGAFEISLSAREVRVLGGSPDLDGSHTLLLSPTNGFSGMPGYGEGGELLFAKPTTVIFRFATSFHGFGALCPAYQSARWSEEAGQVTFADPVGHCRERNLDMLTLKPWHRSR